MIDIKIFQTLKWYRLCGKHYKTRLNIPNSTKPTFPDLHNKGHHKLQQNPNPLLEQFKYES